MTLYKFGKHKSGKIDNVFLRAIETNSLDGISIGNTTEIAPPSDVDDFSVAVFDPKTLTWSIVENPYQVFMCKYNPNIMFDNSVIGEVTSLSGFDIDLSKNKDDFIVLDDSYDAYDLFGSMEESPRVLDDSYVRKVIYDDDKKKWKYIPPKLDLVIASKTMQLNDTAGKMLKTYTSNISGEELTYDTDTEDRTNLDDAISLAQINGSARVRAKNSQGVKDYVELTLEQLSKLKLDILSYKAKVLEDCSMLKLFIDKLDDIEDVHYIRFSDADSIRDGSYVLYTKRDGYQTPDWKITLSDDVRAKILKYERL